MFMEITTTEFLKGLHINTTCYNVDYFLKKMDISGMIKQVYNIQSGNKFNADIGIYLI